MFKIGIKLKEFTFPDSLKIGSKADQINDFIKNNLKVRAVTGVKDFDLYPSQERLIDTIEKNDHTIIRKARQVGFGSTYTGYLIYRIHESLLRDNSFSALIVSTSSHGAVHAMQKIYEMMEVSSFRMQFKRKNKLDALSANGKIYVKSISADRMESLRGVALDMVVIDEADFIDDLNYVMAHIKPSLNRNAKYIVASTPTTDTNSSFKTLFFQNANRCSHVVDKQSRLKYIKKYNRKISPKIYNNDSNKNLTFFPAELLWYIRPNVDEKWRQEQSNILSSELAKCECDAKISGLN